MFHFIPCHCHVHPMKMIFLQLHLWHQQVVIYPSLKTFVWHLSCFPFMLIGWLLFEWIGCGTLRRCCMRTCLLSSFDALLKMLSSALTLNGKYAIMGGLEPISCELMLHCTIRYLAGGSFHDVQATAVISKPSFYRLVWHTIDCINRCGCQTPWSQWIG